MTAEQWLAVLALAAAPVPICETAKALARRGPEGEPERETAAL